jgi:hypothetical protein
MRGVQPTYKGTLHHGINLLLNGEFFGGKDLKKFIVEKFGHRMKKFSLELKRAVIQIQFFTKKAPGINNSANSSIGKLPFRNLVTFIPGP